MPLETLPLRGQMAEQKAEKEGEVAEEPIMSLSSDDSTSEIVASSPGGGAAQILTDEQIIACAFPSPAPSAVLFLFGSTLPLETLLDTTISP